MTVKKAYMPNTQKNVSKAEHHRTGAIFSLLPDHLPLFLQAWAPLRGNPSTLDAGLYKAAEKTRLWMNSQTCCSG